MTAIIAMPLAQDEAAARWRPALITLAATCAGLLALFQREAREIVSIWWNSDTFNHCLLIVPILAWLVWMRREPLRLLTPMPWWPGLFWLGGGALLWLLGEAAGVNLARHASLIVMLQGCVIACLGKAVTRGLLFPLFYALFLVPAGAELVPQLQLITARICMALLNLSGVPAHLDGIFISTSIALFEVAEACAGAKFLIAMLAFGVLAAHLCFRSPLRRAVFILVSILVPILANGIRAWGTVMVAFQTSVEYAVGFDHIVYGGIFFAAVMALVIGLGWPFFDRKVGDPWFAPGDLQPMVPADSRSRLPAMAFTCLVVAAAPILWLGVAASQAPSLPSQIGLPDVPDWERVAAVPTRPWTPGYAGAERVVIGHYRAADGSMVDLAVVAFARQRPGAELIGAGQGAAGTGWAKTADLPPPPNGKAERLMGEEVVREALTFYRIGERLTGNDLAVKIETVRARLGGGDPRAVAVIISAQAPSVGESPRPSLDRFVAALGSVESLADRARGR